MNRRELLKTTILGAAALGMGTARAQDSLSLRLAHDSPVTSAWHIGATRMAEVAREMSNGEIDIRVFPSAQLGDTRELGELTRMGTVDMALMTAGVAASFVPSFNLLGLPFLLNDIEQARELYEGPLGAELMNDAEAAGYKGLGYNQLSFRSPINNRGPIRAPADMSGLKIRLQQVPIHIDTYRALGASPTALPYSEVYSAAHSGVIDGAENSPSNIVAAKFHEVLKHYSDLPVFINACALFMNGDLWARMSSEQQQVIEAAAKECNDTVNEEIIRLDGQALDIMREAGVEVLEGPFDLTEFKHAVEPVYEQYAPQLPESAQGVLEALRS